jgi:hypothetical protein
MKAKDEPLANQGAPIGAPGPVAEISLKIPPYFWVLDGDRLVATGEVAAGWVPAEVVVSGAGAVAAGEIAAVVATAGGGLVLAGVVAVGAVALLQEVMIKALINKTTKRINERFTLASLLFSPYSSSFVITVSELTQFNESLQTSAPVPSLRSKITINA